MTDFRSNNEEQSQASQPGHSPTGQNDPTKPGYRPAISATPGTPPPTAREAYSSAQPPQQSAPPQGYPQQPTPTTHQRPPIGYQPNYPQQPPMYGGPGYGPPQPPSGPPPRSPWQAPEPKRMKRSPIPMIIGLAVLLVMGIVALTAFVGSMAGGSASGGSLLPFGDKIAILEVNGVLGEGRGYGADTERLREVVERWTDDSSIKGMVIRINSPGGAVSATQDLFQAIEEFKKGPDGNGNRPVYASMGDIAASGGYYIAMTADEVYANPGTLTGSVGVILQFWGYEGLTEKVGVEPRTIKSGQFKDIGAGSRPMTPEEKELLDEMIVSVFDQFYDVVLEARGDDVRSFLAEKNQVNPSDVTDEQVREYIRQYTDGRIFSGQQAYDMALVDQLGTMRDAELALKKQLGLSEDTRAVTTPRPQQGLFGLANQKAHAIANMAPGAVTMEYRFSM